MWLLGRKRCMTVILSLLMLLWLATLLLIELLLVFVCKLMLLRVPRSCLSFLTRELWFARQQILTIHNLFRIYCQCLALQTCEHPLPFVSIASLVHTTDVAWHYTLPVQTLPRVTDMSPADM
jgi:hypothetical protein